MIKMKINNRFLFCRGEWEVTTCLCWRGCVCIARKNCTFWDRAHSTTAVSAGIWLILWLTCTLFFQTPVHALIRFHNCSANLDAWKCVSKMYIHSVIGTNISSFNSRPFVVSINIVNSTFWSKLIFQKISKSWTFQKLLDKRCIWKTNIKHCKILCRT